MSQPAPAIKFATAKDGYRYAVRTWRVSEPKAHVVCLHGIVSHGGWYLPSCAYLAERQFCVHLLDRRGSGLNVEARGDVDHWNTWQDDVVDYLQALTDQVPRILLGISWGGTLAAAVARNHGELLNGVGLICPGLFSRKAARAWQRAALNLASAAGLGGRHVAIPLRDPSLFCRTEEAKAYIDSDPLCLWQITVRFALANVALTRHATEHPEQIRVPTLAVLASEDPITVNPLVRDFVARVGNSSQRVIEYPEASHTLEFEPDPTQYFQDLARWCQQAADGHLDASS